MFYSVEHKSPEEESHICLFTRESLVHRTVSGKERELNKNFFFFLRDGIMCVNNAVLMYF